MTQLKRNVLIVLFVVVLALCAADIVGNCAALLPAANAQGARP